MYSQKAVYDDQTNIIELFLKVKIIKGQEIITGDYGYFDTVNNSYKVKSNNTSKVKVTIKNSDE
jgi:lipopolysaccharide export system protein LptA